MGQYNIISNLVKLQFKLMQIFTDAVPQTKTK